MFVRNKMCLKLLNSYLIALLRPKYFVSKLFKSFHTFNCRIDFPNPQKKKKIFPPRVPIFISNSTILDFANDLILAKFRGKHLNLRYP